MTSRDFCYWLQGYFEIASVNSKLLMNEAQIQMIKDHLSMVFAHEIDPSMGDENHQNKLNNIHVGSQNTLIRC